MKKIFLILLILLSGASIALAATPGCDSRGVCTYQPLEPLPGAQAGQTGNNFPALVAGIFKVLISFGGLFAVVMLTVAGIGYMISESAIDIEKAKKRAQAALWGLLLLAGCWLILYTINPDILKFDLFTDALRRLGSPTAPAGTSAPALTQSQIQTLQGTGIDEYKTISREDMNKFNEDEATFRDNCEKRGGYVPPALTASDGTNSSTFACSVPNYRP